MRLAFRGHQSPQGVCPEHELEGPHGTLRKLGDSKVAGADGSTWDLQLEPNLGLRGPRIISRFAQAEPKRQGPAMPLGERRLTQLAQDSKGGPHSTQVLEVDQVDHERHVPHESTTRLVEIHIDTHVLRSRVEMEEEVGAAGRLSVPPALKLMAGGLLESGQFPSGRQDASLDRLDERLERKDGIRGQIRHDRLTSFKKAK